MSAVKHISHKVAILYLGKIIEQGDADRIFASPRHPYSLGLLSSVLLPSTSVKRPTSVSLDGEIPSPINLPKGCSLKSRCPFVKRTEDIPETVHLSDDHVVHACNQCLTKTAKVDIMDYFENLNKKLKLPNDIIFFNNPRLLSQMRRINEVLENFYIKYKNSYK